MLRSLTTVRFFADDLSAARTGTPSCSASSPTSCARTRYNQHYLDVLGDSDE